MFQAMEDGAERDALESFALKLGQHNRPRAEAVGTVRMSPTASDDLPF